MISPMEIIAYAGAALIATIILAVIVMIIAAVILKLREEYKKSNE